MIHLARVRFDDMFDAGELDGLARDLGIPLSALRWASHGKCGLGWAAPPGRRPWLCYGYPDGMKWRNPDPNGKPRFMWIVGRAAAPWRWNWVKPHTELIYLCEGESDPLAVIASGVEADGKSVVVASPGTGFQEVWAPLFKGRRVRICFDATDDGRTATARVAKILAPHAAEITNWKGPTK